jgi:hypothetical protein
LIIKNLYPGELALDGIIIFQPGSTTEVREDILDYVERAQRLQKAGYIEVKFDKLPPEQKEDPKPSTVDNVLAQVNDVLAPKIELEVKPLITPEVVEKPSRKKSNANVGGNTQ